MQLSEMRLLNAFDVFPTSQAQEALLLPASHDAEDAPPKDPKTPRQRTTWVNGCIHLNWTNRSIGYAGSTINGMPKNRMIFFPIVFFLRRIFCILQNWYLYPVSDR